MVCGSWLRYVVSVTVLNRVLTRGVKYSVHRTVLESGPFLTYAQSYKLRSIMASAKMMLDTSSTEDERFIVDNVAEKEDDGGYASGGRKR